MFLLSCIFLVGGPCSTDVTQHLCFVGYHFLRLFQRATKWNQPLFFCAEPLFSHIPHMPPTGKPAVWPATGRRSFGSRLEMSQRPRDAILWFPLYPVRPALNIHILAATVGQNKNKWFLSACPPLCSGESAIWLGVETV